MITNDELKKILRSRERKRKKPIPELTVNSFEKGIQIWDHPDVLHFFNERAMTWIPQKRTAVFLPCSAHKPYFYSQSHSKGYLKALLPYFDEIDIQVISEPMGVVPYCYSNTYPVDSYDYNPNDYFIGNLRNPKSIRSRDIFIQRVARWIKKYHNLYERKLLILPAIWHLKIFKKAIQVAKVDKQEYQIVRLRGRAHISVDYMNEQLAEFFKR